MKKEQLKKLSPLHVVELISGCGYFLVIASILYFIIGAVVGLVGSNMLDWTFCGSVRYLFGINWCDYRPHTGWAWGNLFIHQYINAALPWVTITFGLLVLAISLPLMRAMGFEYKNRDNVDPK